MGCLTCFFANGAMALGGQHCLIGGPAVGVTKRPFTVVRRQRVPQLLTGFGRTVTKSKADNASGLTLQSDPNPDFLPLVIDKRPQLIDLQDRPLLQRTDG